MGRPGKITVALLVLCAAALWAGNSSLLASPPAGTLRLLAHRGVHQDFDRRDLTNETCTATRILPPVSPEIENTLASMRSAFQKGADIVELDIHPTTDGRFAVFHDWTLDCRTEGSGRTRDHAMADLKALDVGYGYTFDGGRTFPLRGKGVGLMPAFDEVMDAFPQGRFLVNFKSRDPGEGERFAAALAANPAWRDRVWGVYGGAEPTETVLARFPDMIGVTPQRAKSCLLGYFALGWSGYVPEACRRTIVMIPQDVAGYLWGWPNRFAARMEAAGSPVVLRGPYFGADADDGIDTPAAAAQIPANFSGIVSTNAVAEIAPLLRGRDR